MRSLINRSIAVQHSNRCARRLRGSRHGLRRRDPSTTDGFQEPRQLPRHDNTALTNTKATAPAWWRAGTNHPAPHRQSRAQPRRGKRFRVGILGTRRHEHRVPGPASSAAVQFWRRNGNGYEAARRPKKRRVGRLRFLVRTVSCLASTACSSGGNNESSAGIDGNRAAFGPSCNWLRSQRATSRGSSPRSSQNNASRASSGVRHSPLAQTLRRSRSRAESASGFGAGLTQSIGSGSVFSCGTRTPRPVFQPGEQVPRRDPSSSLGHAPKARAGGRCVMDPH